jgi:ABC-type branched-subunit amino acid transport system substrate-binding protein
MKLGTRGIWVLFAVVALALAACGNSEPDSSADDDSDPDTTSDTSGSDGTVDLTENVPSDEPGVTDTEIRVGGVTSATNPLGGNYGDAFAGAQAYFDMVNDDGGIYGRELTLVAERDDMLSQNQAEVQALLAQDNIFAALPMAALAFTGVDDLVAENVPTFGWAINPEWAGPENLFGEKGSYLCFTCPSPVSPWLAREIGAEQVAILAYGVSAQSTECAEGYEAAFEKYPEAEVAFQDTSLAFGVPDLSGEVDEMKDAGVDLVFTCMDQNGVNTLARDINNGGLDAVLYLPNGYDEEFAQEFADVLDGSYVGIQFWPFEVTEDRPAAMDDYFEWMEKIDGPINEISITGWMNADLLVTGLRAAGPGFTRQSVIDAINQIEEYDAGGIHAGVDWTIQHTEQNPQDCFSILKVVDGAFEPQFGEPGKPFVCLDSDADELPAEPVYRS